MKNEEKGKLLEVFSKSDKGSKDALFKVDL